MMFQNDSRIEGQWCHCNVKCLVKECRMFLYRETSNLNITSNNISCNISTIFNNFNSDKLCSDIPFIHVTKLSTLLNFRLMFRKYHLGKVNHSEMTCHPLRYLFLEIMLDLILEVFLNLVIQHFHNENLLIPRSLYVMTRLITEYQYLNMMGKWSISCTASVCTCLILV